MVPSTARVTSDYCYWHISWCSCYYIPFAETENTVVFARKLLLFVVARAVIGSGTILLHALCMSNAHRSNATAKITKPTETQR